MPADSYYEDLNERLAGEQFCVGENDRESTEAEALEAIELGAAEEEEPTCDECGHAIRLHMDMYGCEYERGDAPGDGECCAMAFPPCGCQAYAEEYEREQIIEASRSVRAGTAMLFAALRDNGVL